MTIAEARQAVGQSLGLPPFDDPADLNSEQRERLYDALARFIITNNAQFDRSAYAWAERRIDSPFYRTPPSEYGVTDAIKSFSGEFANQAGKVASFQNPFVSRVVLGLAIGAGIYLALKAGALGKALKAVKA